MKNNMSIYIATHKKFNEPDIENYIPIQVGADLHDDLGYIGDNLGENISEKNNSFCELTALYNIWKNKNDDVVGLVHYRRYFFKKIFFYKKNSDYTREYISFEKAKKLLNSYDIILPIKWKFSQTVKEQYAAHHYIKDLEKCGEIIRELYPSYYSSFENILNGNELHPFNMFICSKKIFDNYCEWLFDVLFRVENVTDISEYDKYNQRLYGFLSERLFNVYVYANKLKVKQLPVYNIEDSREEWNGNTRFYFKSGIKRIIKRR